MVRQGYLKNPAAGKMFRFSVGLQTFATQGTVGFRAISQKSGPKRIGKNWQERAGIGKGERSSWQQISQWASWRFRAISRKTGFKRIFLSR